MAKTARRSGGHKIAAGKLVTSRNALNTGTCSSITVLPEENTSEYEALESQFLADFEPADLAESAMVHELAALTWSGCRAAISSYST